MFFEHDVFWHRLLIPNASVEFWDNEIQFGQSQVSVDGNGATVASAVWVVSNPDTHHIRVTISPFNLPVEASYDNNTISKEVVLGQPIIGVESDRKQKLWLAPAIPNPSRGMVRFNFTMPSRSR